MWEHTHTQWKEMNKTVLKVKVELQRHMNENDQLIFWKKCMRVLNFCYSLLIVGSIIQFLGNKVNISLYKVKGNN